MELSIKAMKMRLSIREVFLILTSHFLKKLIECLELSRQCLSTSYK